MPGFAVKVLKTEKSPNSTNEIVTKKGATGRLAIFDISHRRPKLIATNPLVRKRMTAK